MDSQIQDTGTEQTQLFLQVPLPAHNNRTQEKRTGHASLASKENRNPGSPMASSAGERVKDARKRKLSDATPQNSESGSARKKRNNGSDTLLAKITAATNDNHHEYFYCHQCSKKRELGLDITCTWLGASHGACKTRYCKACLKNRYGQDMEAIKSTPPGDRKSTEGHTKTLGYIWRCPRCSDECNCKGCRKKLGLGPTGNLSFAARRKGLGSAAQILAEDPSTLGVMKGNKLPEEQKAVRVRKLPKIIVTENGEVVGSPAEVKTKKKGRPVVDKIKEPPEPEWEPIDSDLEFHEIEDRIALREFAIRFASQLELKVNTLEDLDEFDHFNDSTCLALVRGMIQIIAKHTQDKPVVDASRALRNIGPVPTKIWAVLDQARASSDRGAPLAKLPSPSEAIHNAYNTRTGQSLTQAAQLLPVLLHLMEQSLDTEVIRDAIEQGYNEGKQEHREVSRQVKELKEAWTERKKVFAEERASNEENKSWDQERWKTSMKAEDKQHRDQVSKLEGQHHQVAPQYAPRFRNIGTDLDGRIYYVLSPLNNKRRMRDEDRSNFKKWSTFVAVWGKRGTVVRAPEKEEDSDSDEDDDEEEDEPEVQWWGFYDIKDIRKLARWLQWKGDVRDATEGPVGFVRKRHHDDASKGEEGGQESDMDTMGPPSENVSRAVSPLSDLSILSEDEGEGNDTSEERRVDMKNLDLGGPTSTAEMKSLVKKLNEFADWLEWRTSKPEEGKA